MLNLTEFAEEEVLRNSDGNILKVYSNNTYVVLWDDNITNEQEVNDFINERKYYDYDVKIYFSNKLVLMRKDEWEVLSKMITDNYNMVEKGVK